MGSHAGLVSQDFPIQCLRMGTKDRTEGGWKCPAGQQKSAEQNSLMAVLLCARL